jgi:hypothetical protein
MTTKKNKVNTPQKRENVATVKKGSSKVGRPVRMDNPQKITLHLALNLKRRAYDLACSRRCSISRLVEDLIEGCKV